MEDINYVCNNILNLLGNNSTKVKVEETAKGSYYVFLNDTIYLSKNQILKNEKGTSLVLMCHECIHSKQSKLLQIINFLMSNLEIILFITAIILKYIMHKQYIIPIYIVASLTSILIRWILEMDASLKSINLAKRYLEQNEQEYDIENIKKKMKLTFPIFFLYLFWFKILRIILIII